MHVQNSEKVQHEVESQKTQKLRIKARKYTIIKGVLFRKSFLEPWLRCVGLEQANYVLREIHETSCNMHSETRAIVVKAIQSGYYWPNMHKDAREVIQKCQDCQVHRPVPTNPQHKLTPITSPRPLYKWGLYVCVPFPEA